MTNIDCHIAFIRACGRLEKLGMTANAFSAYAECQRLINQGNLARRKSNLDDAARLFDMAQST